MKKIGVFVFLMVLALGVGIAAEMGVEMNAQGGLQNGSATVATLYGQGNMTLEQRREMFEDGQTLRMQFKEQNKAQLREIQLIRERNQIRIHAGNYSVNCSGECNYTENQERAMLMKRLSNGANAEIKIMPDTAAERALERLRLHVCNESNNCTLQLKEVSAKGNVSLAYEMQRERKAKVLGFIGTKMDVRAQVDAETGEVIKVRKPWWAFLASEPQEE